MVVFIGLMTRRRFVMRQQKNPVMADPPTMIVGGMPTLIFSATTKRTINPNAMT